MCTVYWINHLFLYSKVFISLHAFFRCTKTWIFPDQIKTQACLKDLIFLRNFPYFYFCQSYIYSQGTGIAKIKALLGWVFKKDWSIVWEKMIPKCCTFQIKKKVANIAPINEESFHKKLKFNDVNGTGHFLVIFLTKWYSTWTE